MGLYLTSVGLKPGETRATYVTRSLENGLRRRAFWITDDTHSYEFDHNEDITQRYLFRDKKSRSMTSTRIIPRSGNVGDFERLKARKDHSDLGAFQRATGAQNMADIVSSVRDSGVGVLLRPIIRMEGRNSSLDAVARFELQSADAAWSVSDALSRELTSVTDVAQALLGIISAMFDRNGDILRIPSEGSFSLSE